MESATVVEWLKKPGDALRAGESVVLVETAKATTEIPAPCDGVLARVVAAAGNEVKVDGLLAMIEVRDGGPGIAESERATVFDRFHRTPDARAIPGSGLGLAIVASAVADARGTVTLGDAPEGGLLVRVTLPR